MKKKCSGTEIVSKLRQADVLIAQGKTVPDVCREIGVTSQTYYRWRNKYGGLEELEEFFKRLAILSVSFATCSASSVLTLRSSATCFSRVAIRSSRWFN